MKMIRNKLAGILLALMLAAVLVPTRAFAFVTIRTDRPVSLTVSASFDGDALEGMSFRLYQIAKYAENGSITVVDADYPVLLDREHMSVETAEVLAAYLERDKAAPADQAETGTDGIITFPAGTKSLFPGIYLLVSEPFSDKDYTYQSSPVLLSLPEVDENARYDVTSSVKTSRTENRGETVSRSVVKVWEGDSVETRPEQITVQLLCSGAVYDTVRLTEANGWQYMWKHLPKLGEDGSVNRWTVTEETVPGYTVTVFSSGTVLRITNTAGKMFPETTNTQDKLPQMGLLWWPVPILCVAGAVFLLLGKYTARLKIR